MALLIHKRLSKSLSMLYSTKLEAYGVRDKEKYWAENCCCWKTASCCTSGWSVVTWKFLNGQFSGLYRVKFYIFLMEWDRGWVMAFPLVSLLFWGVEYDRPSLNPFCFSEKIFYFLYNSLSMLGTEYTYSFCQEAHFWRQIVSQREFFEVVVVFWKEETEPVVVPGRVYLLILNGR